METKKVKIKKTLCVSMVFIASILFFGFIESLVPQASGKSHKLSVASAKIHPSHRGKEKHGKIIGHIEDKIAKDKNKKNSPKKKYKKKRLLIKFSSETRDEMKKGKKPKIPHKMKHKFKKGEAWVLELDEGESVDEALAKYKEVNSELFEYVQPDYACYAIQAESIEKVKDLLPSQLYIDSQEYPLQNSQLLWHLNDINVEAAWGETEGDPSVVIAILDTGVAYEDTQFTEQDYLKVSNVSTYFKKAPGLSTMNLWSNNNEIPNNNIDDDGNGYIDDVNGFDFVNHDGYPNDDCGHGTFLANLMAYDFDEERVGIAPQCTFMIVKVLDYNGKGYSSGLAEGIYYAVNHGAKILNLSLAWPAGIDPGPIVQEAIQYAANAGVIIVGGTGNEAKNKVCYPAAYEEVIGIGATQFDRTQAYYSNYGKDYVEVMAPGGNITLDQNGDGYPDGIFQETLWPRYMYTTSEEILANPSIFGFTFTQGTSMATAVVTGVVGLMLSVDPAMSLQDIRNVLYYTAVDIEKAGWDKLSGYGLINAGEAIATICLGGPYDFEAPSPIEIDSGIDEPTDDPASEPDDVIDTDIESHLYGPCTHPDCLNDEEIELECDSCLNDEEIEEECE